ncbi:hypothetical protein OAQ28_08370, partial [Planktomarina temperata]|nr:hypothetical protein [Planktomarina temperata]
AALFGPNDISLQLAQVTYSLNLLLRGFGSKCLCGHAELMPLPTIIPQTGDRRPKPPHHCKIYEVTLLIYAKLSQFNKKRPQP